ncbi:MAG: rRNA pseudouridine synthase [Hyphomonadaceae bacterium]|jgi:23S rRNA pseudouridine2604 synthase|nr:rRNA pseudouridine synthase [Hyphomonadaceae bacterium]
MAWRKIYEGAEPQRVNKWLAGEGVCSRREAEEMIANGLVRIDGAIVEDPGRKIEPGQTIELADGRVAPRISIAINKPVGFVSAQPEPGQVPAARLVTPANLVGRTDVMPTSRTSLAPLGRLDQDSRGLLLLSEDGVLAKAVIGAESNVDKEYLVGVRGQINDRKLDWLRHGLELDGKKLKPAKIDVVEPWRIRFILNEGKKRQIRRMCELVELEVVDLLRVRIGPMWLGDLPEGRWRAITSAEREALLKASR